MRFFASALPLHADTSRGHDRTDRIVAARVNKLFDGLTKAKLRSVTYSRGLFGRNCPGAASEWTLDSPLGQASRDGGTSSRTANCPGSAEAPILHSRGRVSRKIQIGLGRCDAGQKGAQNRGIRIGRREEKCRNNFTHRGVDSHVSFQSPHARAKFLKMDRPDHYLRRTQILIGVHW